MPGVRTFTELQCWQRARQWSKSIFAETTKPPFEQDRRLCVQVNDSSASVMANIAEGFGRGTQNEFVLFLGYAIGSLDETHSHLCAAYDRGYLTKVRFAELFRDGTETRKLTVAFIRSMIQPSGGVRSLGRRTTWSADVWEIYERLTGKPRPERFQTSRDDGVSPRTQEPPV